MFHNFVDKATFWDVNIFYMLNQTTIIGLMLQRYGGSTLKKVTTNGKVCVAGIPITNSDVCANLPDMTGQLRGGNRQLLDGSRSCWLGGLCLLHQKFADIEVIVNVTDRWLLLCT